MRAYVQKVELLPLSRKAYVVIAFSLPLRPTLTGRIAMLVQENPAPVRLQGAVFILAIPLLTCDVPSATPILLPTAVSSLGLSQGCVCKTVGCFLGQPSILQDFLSEQTFARCSRDKYPEPFGQELNALLVRATS